MQQFADKEEKLNVIISAVSSYACAYAQRMNTRNSTKDATEETVAFESNYFTAKPVEDYASCVHQVAKPSFGPGSMLSKSENQFNRALNRAEASKRTLKKSQEVLRRALSDAISEGVPRAGGEKKR